MLAARSEIMERMRSAFRAEALDLLPELDAALLAMEVDPHNASLVNRVFRAMHTIKGSGATAGFAHLAHFAHGVEEAFDLARANKLAVTSELIDCGLKACDVIREILSMEDDTCEATDERAVTEAVSRLLPASQAAVSQEAHAAAPAGNALAAYRLLFRPGKDLFRSGTDPLSLLEELRELGAATITAHAAEVPSLASFDAEACYLWWEILLLTERGEEEIRDVFVFVEDDSLIDLHLLPHQADCIAFLLLAHEEQTAALDRAAAACLTAASQVLERHETTPQITQYLQTLPPLAIAARCSQDNTLADAVDGQGRILERVLRVGRPMSQQDKRRLTFAMRHIGKESLACA